MLYFTVSHNTHCRRRTQHQYELMHSSHFTSSNTTKENNIYCYITWSTTSPNHSPRTQQKRHKVVLVVQRIKSVIARDIIKGLSLQGQGQEHNFVLNDNQGSTPRTTSVINATLDHRYNALWYNTDLITTWLHVFMDCPELDIDFIISESRSYTVLRPTKWAGALSTSPLEGGRPVGPSTMHSASIEWLA